MDVHYARFVIQNVSRSEHRFMVLDLKPPPGSVLNRYGSLCRFQGSLEECRAKMIELELESANPVVEEKSQQTRVEALGWRDGDASDFLEMSPEETELYNAVSAWERIRRSANSLVLSLRKEDLLEEADTLQDFLEVVRKKMGG